MCLGGLIFKSIPEEVFIPFLTYNGVPYTDFLQENLPVLKHGNRLALLFGIQEHSVSENECIKELKIDPLMWDRRHIQLNKSFEV